MREHDAQGVGDSHRAGRVGHAEPVLADLRVCVVGNSFVAGVGDPDHLGWVGRVAARTHRGRPLTTYALGVRGQTSRDVADRWRAECAPRLPPGCDGRVVVAFGVNDTTIEEGATQPRVPARDSATNLASVLRDLRDAEWPSLVVGPPPIANSAQNKRIADLDTAFSSVCADAGVGYARVFEQLSADPVWMRQVAEQDGAHPGTRGYQRLADLVWPWWQSWITAGIP